MESKQLFSSLTEADKMESELIKTLTIARKKQGMSQAELAKAIGVSETHIKNIESLSTNAKLYRLAKMAEVLNLTITITPNGGTKK